MREQQKFLEQLLKYQLRLTYLLLALLIGFAVLSVCFPIESVEEVFSIVKAMYWLNLLGIVVSSFASMRVSFRIVKRDFEKAERKRLQSLRKKRKATRAELLDDIEREIAKLEKKSN